MENELKDKELNKNEKILTAEDAEALSELYGNVVLALKQVYDPEIPVNIYDLGLIYDIHIDKDRKVDILMTFTAPNCPMADEVMVDVREQVSQVPGVTSCHIELTFDPVWDRSMLSEEAKVELGMEDLDNETNSLD
jgi:FeS assembly SUF system protein